MKILLIQKEGIDLHHTLFVSETSRLILRFYHPKKLPCGVSITVSTLGSALSLASELRWYIRRYVREMLFEAEKGCYCTHQLAQDVYFKRAVILENPWAYRRLYGFRNGKLASQVIMAAGATAEEYHQEVIGVDTTLIVWCTEDEVEDIGEPIPLETDSEIADGT